jgi:hypothetical protein
MIQHHGPCRSAHLKLGAHFLDLRSLLFELRRQALYFFLLLRDRSLEIILYGGFATGSE